MPSVFEDTASGNGSSGGSTPPPATNQIKTSTMKKNSLYKTLEKQGHDEETIIEIIEEMVLCVLNEEDPEEVLFDNGLEPDYIMDLIEYCETINVYQ